MLKALDNRFASVPLVLVIGVAGLVPKRSVRGSLLAKRAAGNVAVERLERNSRDLIGNAWQSCRLWRLGGVFGRNRRPTGVATLGRYNADPFQVSYSRFSNPKARQVPWWNR